MAGMDMKLFKRMDMGGGGPETTGACRAADQPWLETLAYCIQSSCGAEGVSDRRREQYFQANAADGTEVQSLKQSLPQMPPTDELADDETWLNRTSLVNADLYAANRRTLEEFGLAEERHTRYKLVKPSSIGNKC
jgi:hypothetical protein